MSKSYVEATRGIITASKIKTFIKSPALYKIIYIDEVELEEEEPRHFVIGNAFDCLVSYGEEKFLDTYYIDDGLVVDELKKKLIEQGLDEAEVKKMKLPELRARYYKDGDRIRLTPQEGKDIMGMYRECKRQPLADLGSDYQTQYRIEGEYNGIRIGGALDRFDLERGLIRDWKTSGNFDNFEYDIEETFDYVLSMAFYYVLAYVKHGKECDVILDVLGKKAPYPYMAYKLSHTRLRNKVVSTIKPALEFYSECLRKNERPNVSPIYRDDQGQPLPIDRKELMKSPYYQYMDCVEQVEFVEP